MALAIGTHTLYVPNIDNWMQLTSGVVRKTLKVDEVSVNAWIND